jgi:hypothetical protein
MTAGRKRAACNSGHDNSKGGPTANKACEVAEACNVQLSFEQAHDLRLANLLKCRLKPITAAEVSSFTSPGAGFAG